MQLDDMSNFAGVVHEQEPVKKLREALNHLAREERNAVQTNAVTNAVGGNNTESNSGA